MLGGLLPDRDFMQNRFAFSQREEERDWQIKNETSAHKLRKFLFAWKIHKFELQNVHQTFKTCKNLVGYYRY
jgi:hypothetical protein